VALKTSLNAPSMLDKNVSPSQKQNLNAKNLSLSNNVLQSLRLTIPLATVALCVLNSNRPVFATDLNATTATKKVTIVHSSLPQDYEDIKLQKYQHPDYFSGWRSRIVNLFTSVFKTQLNTNLSEANNHQPEPEPQNKFHPDGMGGMRQDFAPIYLSQAQSVSTKEFLVTTKINSLPIAKDSSTVREQDKFKTYTVKTGDTIYRIAERLQVDRQELIALNKINNSNIIFVDQKLKLPLPAAKLAQNQAEKTNINNGNVKVPLFQGRENLTLTDFDFPRNSIKQTSPLSTSPNYLGDIQPKSENRLPLKVASNKTVVGLAEDKESLTKLRAKKVDAASSIKPQTNLSSNSILQEAIALKLPPLPSFNEYLPEAFDGKYIWPAQGVLTSGYGWRWGKLHQGIDIAAPVGTPVLAAAAGEVVSADWDSGGYGNLVKIQHPDGSITVYGHNDQILVNSGQQVSPGEQIAAMGNTGFSTGSHLHFEIHLPNEGIVDPLALLD
jgi:murein DD-endopeptidase MepM/ murein hydrolase activator NlpD